MHHVRYTELVSTTIETATKTTTTHPVGAVQRKVQRSGIRFELRDYVSPYLVGRVGLVVRVHPNVFFEIEVFDDYGWVCTAVDAEVLDEDERAAVRDAVKYWYTDRWNLATSALDYERLLDEAGDDGW